MLFLSYFVMLSCMSVDALWSPTGKGLTSLLSFMMSNCDVVTFPLVAMVKVWCLIASFPYLCLCLTLMLNSTEYDILLLI